MRMFGYIRLYKPDVKMGEYEQYRGVYCTLCRRLGRRYGPLARLSLSYDLTFLALLDMAQAREDPGFCPGRCSFNPAKRCLKCRRTDAIDRAADISALLTYHKLRDTLADEGLFKRLGAALCLPVAAWHHRRAAGRQPQAAAHIAAMMTAQATVERQAVSSIDPAAEPFALLLQWLAADTARDDKQRAVLERFGYCLGRWVYLIDAVDDWEKDRKSGNYNPYLAAKPVPADDMAGLRAYAARSLNACLAECIAAYNLLEIRRFDGILRNILEQGMPFVQQRVIAGEEQAHESRSL